MSREVRYANVPVYDRWSLLGEENRNRVLALWEVHKYGLDSFGDPEYVAIYGLKPTQWYARGVRILARTAVECTRDPLADQIGRDIAAVARGAGGAGGSVVIDPCAGSCNTLYWIKRHLRARRAIGCELADGVFQTTRHNLSIMELGIDLIHQSYQKGVPELHIPREQLLVAFISPPWGRTLSEDSGLDLRRTTPPVADVIDLIGATFTQHRLLFATQLYEHFNERSVADVSTRFDWSTLKIYDINAQGQNHGLLLGARGWSP